MKIVLTSRNRQKWKIEKEGDAFCDLLQGFDKKSGSKIKTSIPLDHVDGFHKQEMLSTR